MTPSEIVAAGRQEEEAFGLAGPPKIFSSVRVKPTTKQPGKPVHRKARSGKEQPFIDPEDFSVRVSTRSGRGARASVKEGGMGRFSELMRAIQEDKNKDRDGAVHRTEFDVNILYKDLGADRERIEGFVLAKTHKAHRYMLAKGGQGIVYHDQRGRAVSCAINDIPDGELYWLARQKGWNSNRESTSLE